jgi:hypothetical protein
MLDDIHDTVLVLGPKALEASKAVFGYLQVAAVSTGEVNSTVRGLNLRKRASRKPAAPKPPASAGSAPSQPTPEVQKPEDSKAA